MIQVTVGKNYEKQYIVRQFHFYETGFGVFALDTLVILHYDQRSQVVCSYHMFAIFSEGKTFSFTPIQFIQNYTFLFYEIMIYHDLSI